jgi:hypothetical protein
MNATLRTLFCTVAVAGVSSAAIAASATTDTMKSTKQAAGAHTSVNGKVTSINAETKTFKVSYKAKDGKETESEISWTADTKLYWHDAKKTAAAQSDLKVGAEVMVKTEKKDASWVAHEIWFKPEMAGKPADKTPDMKK